jgi:hypothetical protein
MDVTGPLLFFGSFPLLVIFGPFVLDIDFLGAFVDFGLLTFALLGSFGTFIDFVLPFLLVLVPDGGFVIDLLVTILLVLVSADGFEVEDLSSITLLGFGFMGGFVGAGLVSLGLLVLVSMEGFVGLTLLPMP